MKKTLTHLTTKALLCAAVSGFLSGCAAMRPIDDAALGAGGAYLGNELSHGNPIATVAGAAGGVLVSEGLHHAAKTQSDKSYANGYDKGKSDARGAGSAADCGSV